jgi:hypothetical protein
MPAHLALYNSGSPFLFLHLEEKYKQSVGAGVALGGEADVPS